MLYNAKFRSDMWDKYTEIQNKIQDLKSIVQNPMEIKAADLVQQKKIGVEIKNAIDELQERLQRGE